MINNNEDLRNENRTFGEFLSPPPPPAENIAEKKEEEYGHPKDLLGEAILSSSIHGIAGMWRVESITLRIILTIFFLISMGYCGYQLYITITNFMSFSVFTTTSFNHEIPAEFPGK
jgi:hypothetical protein